MNNARVMFTLFRRTFVPRTRTIPTSVQACYYFNVSHYLPERFAHDIAIMNLVRRMLSCYCLDICSIVFIVLYRFHSISIYLLIFYIRTTPYNLPLQFSFSFFHPILRALDHTLYVPLHNFVMLIILKLRV